MRIATMLGLALTVALATRVCNQRYDVPHVGAEGPWNVVLYMWHTCDSAPGAQPSVFIASGALVRSASYAGFAYALALHGFSVFVSDYTGRDFFGVEGIEQARRDMGFDCPRNGTFPSVSALHDTMRFARDNGLADLNRVLLFAHSFGTFVAQYSFYHKCRPSRSDTFCEGALNEEPPYRAQVIALYEGVGGFERNHPTGTLLLDMESQFWNAADASKWFLSGRARAITIRMNDSVNHFAPNDFAPAFNHAHTNCSMIRSGAPEQFATTAQVQADVVQYTADIIAFAYQAYIVGGDALVPSIADVLCRMNFVAYARTLPML